MQLAHVFMWKCSWELKNGKCPSNITKSTGFTSSFSATLADYGCYFLKPYKEIIITWTKAKDTKKKKKKILHQSKFFEVGCSFFDSTSFSVQSILRPVNNQCNFLSLPMTRNQWNWTLL